MAKTTLKRPFTVRCHLVHVPLSDKISVIVMQNGMPPKKLVPRSKPKVKDKMMTAVLQIDISYRSPASIRQQEPIVVTK